MILWAVSRMEQVERWQLKKRRERKAGTIREAQF